jgi:hypothetical protein
MLHNKKVSQLNFQLLLAALPGVPLIFSPAVSRKAQYSGDDPIVIARRGTQFVLIS